MAAQSSRPPTALTIAGSDSGGAAGLQADLKTFTALGVYGMSAVTAVTAQNSTAVAGILPVPAEFIAAQIDAVLSDYGADAVKTGFLGRSEIVAEVAGRLSPFQVAHLVVDPVLVNHRGEPMFATDVTRAYVERLFPLAELVTPNWREAALLVGMEVSEPADLEKAARQLFAAGPQWVLITGYLTDASSVDVLFDGRELRTLERARVATANTHGSGDTLSAAVCAFLAQGAPLPVAVERARQYTAAAISGAAGWTLGAGHGPLKHW
jgi:hydroxymethylpyrimidine/phosphomethylpyrimidine kinase